MAMAATAPGAACSLGRGRGDAKFTGLLTFVAVAKLGLHDRFGSADEGAWSSGRRKLSVACSVAEQSLGDFCCLLYSPLKMVATASSRAPRRRGLTSKRKLQARATAGDLLEVSHICRTAGACGQRDQRDSGGCAHQLGWHWHLQLRHRDPFFGPHAGSTSITRAV